MMLYVEWCDPGCKRVGLKSFAVSIDYRDYMGSSSKIWALRCLFLYLCSYNLVGSVTSMTPSHHITITNIYAPSDTGTLSSSLRVLRSLPLISLAPSFCLGISTSFELLRKKHPLPYPTQSLFCLQWYNQSAWVWWATSSQSSLYLVQ
jgi:hypothetical protein